MSHEAPTATQVVVDTGIIPAYGAAPAAGLALPGTGDVFIHVKNGGGGSINVTAVTGGTLAGKAVSDEVVAIAAGAEKMIGPFKPQLYNQPSGATHADKVLIEFSGVTTVTYGVFQE
jgi:hypothetical protein